MQVNAGVWVAFVAFVLGTLTLDFVVFGRRAAPSLRAAAGWSVAWTALGVAFAAVLWTWRGGGSASEYLTGFLIEKSLSLDNLFVFALIFSTFAVPLRQQRRVLHWGIVGAVALRGGFIAAGAAVLDATHVTVYLFGAFLVVTGVRMALQREKEIHPERSPVLRALARVLPVTTSYDGDRFLTRAGGRTAATPLVAALVLVATFDVLFAADSIPAVFAVTRDTFVVFAANAFSLLGLQALYFLLARMLGRFEYLKLGLATILVFIGVKMALADVVHLAEWVSLAVIVGALGTAVAASIGRGHRREARRRRLDRAVVVNEGRS